MKKITRRPQAKLINSHLIQEEIMQYIKRILKKIVIGFAFMLLTLFFHDGQAFAEIYSSISGHVTAEDTGKGLEGVVALARKAGSGKNNQFLAITDKKGVYVLKDLTEGYYVLGFYTKEASPYLIETPHREVVVPKGKNVVNFNHILKLGGVVSGIVSGSDEKPMNRVSVSANVPNFKPEWIDHFKAELTDINGKYLLQGLPESDSCVVQVKVPGHAKLIKTVKITKGQIAELNFIVKSDDITGISGYVKSSIDGKPIQDAEIVIRDKDGEDIGNSYTDDTGKYSIIGVAPGLYKTTAFEPKGDEIIKKENILIEQGKSTVVSFDFGNSASN